MASRLLARFHPGLFAAVVGTLALTAGLASLGGGLAGEPGPPALDGYLGVPDCPAGAVYDPLAPRSLQCWLYTGPTGWRITKRTSAHHAFVVRVQVSNLDQAPAVARAIVHATRPAFGEVMVYATAVPGLAEPGIVEARDDIVTRIRWTEQDGFDTLSFRRPAAN